MLGRVEKHIAVVGAVIVRGDAVLCAQRGPGGAQAGLWEFPGGKVEVGETAESALIREVREELGCEIAVGPEVTTTTHAYPAITVTLTTYYCELTDGDPVPHEHARLEWRERSRLGDLPWAPADLPAVDLVRRSVE